MTVGVRLGGRAAGTPNKRTSELLNMLSERFPDYHPVLAMAEIANDTSVAVDIRLDCHKQIAPYVVPKLKAIEVSGVDGEPLELVPAISIAEAARAIDFLMASVARG